MTIDLSAFRSAFLEEAREHATVVEQGLLRLERDPAQLESVHEVFRAAHSIKGAAATLGLHEIAQFTHRLETILDAMRQGTLLIDRNRVTVLLHATDELRRLIQGLANDEQLCANCADLDALMNQLGQITAPGKPHRDGPTLEAAKRRMLTLAINPAPRFFATKLDPILIFRDLESLGSVGLVTCDFSRVPPLSQLDPEQCYVSWSTRLLSEATDTVIVEHFLFIADDCDVSITEDPRFGADIVAPRHETVGHPAIAQDSSTLRVSSEKVDAIINLVGELVIAQSMVMQILDQGEAARNPTLRDAADSMRRNMQELQERVMGIRMVPISTLFGRFSRMIRDIAPALDKTVELELSGQDTEIDKAVEERLVDPITHLVRNALDHGLETDAERRALGKAEGATIRLSGQHVAGGIVIEVSDNGRGLDTARIREQAERRGLIGASESLTDEEIHSLIFEPGFSTVSEVSDLSGRGVGMDVVRRCVDAMNGTITLLSASGLGTTICIRLPLTLAILDGLLLRVGKFTYIVPLLSVIESFRPLPQTLKHVAGSGTIALVRDVALPLVDLGTELGLLAEPRDPCNALVVVVQADARQVGLVVDAMIGQSQVVVKSIEAHYRRVDGILGATILGDGQVAFIIDVAGLVRLVWSSKSMRRASRAA